MADEKDSVIEETEVEEVEEAEGEEGSEEESSEAKESPTDELDEKSLADAKSLFLLLKNPATQQATIRAMAAGAGLLGKETPETKQEVKEAKADLLATLKKSLGPELEWLAVKLSPALTEMLEEERKGMKAQLSTVEQTQTEQEVSRAWDKLHEETKGLSRKFEARMTQLADEIYPAPNQTSLQYLRNLYKIAASDRTASTTRQQMTDKINRNAKDAAGRLQSSGTTKGKDHVPAGNLSLKDTVQSVLRNMGKT